jgi:hypothetical protein
VNENFILQQTVIMTNTLYNLKSFSSLLIFLNLSLALSAQQLGINYDENKIPHYTLPDLLKKQDGKKITSIKEWASHRPNILKQFENQVFGKIPSKPESMTFQVTKLLPEALGGKARLKEIRIKSFDGKEGSFIDLLVFLPKNTTGKVPVFLVCNFGGNHRVHPSTEISLTKTWVSNYRGGIKGKTTGQSRGAKKTNYSIDELLENGYGLATYHCADVDPDRNNFEDGIHPYYYKKGQKKTPQ